MPAQLNILAYNERNLNQWKEQLKNREKLIDLYSERHQHLNSKFDVAGLVDGYKADKQEAANNVAAIEAFMQTLATNPEQLVHELRDRMQNLLRTYEENHFTAPSPAVRMGLLNLQYGLTFLMSNADKATPQQQYLRLCGMVWELYSRVQEENQDDAFLKELVALVHSTHIEPQGNLADKLDTGYDAVAWYQAVKEANATHFINTIEELSSKERKIHQEVMDFLLDPQLLGDTKLRQNIINVAQDIKLEVQDKIRRGQAVDYYFYNRVAQDLQTLYRDPENAQAARRLTGAAEYASGAPSVGKKLLAGLAMVVGVLIVAASIAGFVATVGGSSFISAGAMAVGLSLLEAQCAVVVGASISAAVGARVTFWGAASLQADTRQGLSQNLVDIKI